MRKIYVYSIGYEALAPARLLAIASALDANVVDCRSSLSRCKSGYGPKQLRELLGDRYTWQGHHLGGRVIKGKSEGTTIDGLRWVRDWPTSAYAAQHGQKDRKLLLMCKEEAPGECHRHQMIALGLLGCSTDPIGIALGRDKVDVAHIYRDEVLLASVLERSMQNGRPYSCADLEEVLRGSVF